MSNPTSERMFPKLKQIKTLQRDSFGANRFENILRIIEDGPPVEDFNTMPAGKCWSNAKDRWLNQNLRKNCKPGQSNSHNTDTKPDSDNEYKSEEETGLVVLTSLWLNCKL